jgi:phosphoribosyl-ATP pyrophosphohydrolase
MHLEKSNEIKVFMEGKERTMATLKQQLAQEKYDLINKFEAALRRKALDSEHILQKFKETKDLND